MGRAARWLPASPQQRRSEGAAPMDVAGLLVFAGVYFLAAASPGPGIAAVMARSLSTGFRRAVPLVLGIAAGDLVWLAFSAPGLSLLVQLPRPVPGDQICRLRLSRLEALDRAGQEPRAGAGGPRRGPAPVFRRRRADARQSEGDGLLRLDPAARRRPAGAGAARLRRDRGADHADHQHPLLGYAFAADRARRLVSSPRTMRRINRLTGGVMAGAAAAIAARG